MPEFYLGMDFSEKIQRAARRNQSWLCVGLDPDPSQIPAHLTSSHGEDTLLEFNRAIIEQTKDIVCAFKPNSAFYEALGPRGLQILIETRKLIPSEIPMILDAKRGDIGNTARRYAQAAFEVYGADAVTLSPYLGLDSIEPFADYADRGLFLLCRTSNPRARDLQDLVCQGRPLFEVVAAKIAEWSAAKGSHQFGAVAGATYATDLRAIREILGDELLILVPGVGKQAGELEMAVRAGVNSSGERAIFNAARSVLYASSGKDFAQAARAEALRLRDAINRITRST